MKIQRTIQLLLLVILLILLAATPAFAQSGGGYDLSWSSLEGGSAQSSNGGGFSLAGNISKLEPYPSSNEGFQLVSGFRPSGGVLQVGYSIFLPLILRD